MSRMPVTRILAVAALVGGVPPAAPGAAAQAPAEAGRDSASARSGLYLTAADYAAGRLTYGIDCRTGRHEIDRHTLLGRPYVDVTHEGQRYRHAKRETYGYRECGGRVARFLERHEYDVLSAGPLFLYSGDVLVPGPKGGVLRATGYFFSTASDTPLSPLTRAALKASYPNHHRFHELLDRNVRSDAELAVYDAPHEQYRVVRLLVQAGRPERVEPPSPRHKMPILLSAPSRRYASLD